MFAYQGIFRWDTCISSSLGNASSLGSFSLISLYLSLSILDKWSMTTFFVLFLSRISKSNFLRKRIHHIRHGLTPFLLSRHLMVTWYMYTITLDPTKYDMNLSNANTTVSSSFSVVA